MAGRFGPYVTDGTTNASIPKGMSPENLTFDQATDLLEARRNAAPSPKRGGFKRKSTSAGGTRTKRARAKAAGA